MNLCQVQCCQFLSCALSPSQGIGYCWQYRKREAFRFLPVLRPVKNQTHLSKTRIFVAYVQAFSVYSRAIGISSQSSRFAAMLPSCGCSNDRAGSLSSAGSEQKEMETFISPGRGTD